MSTSIVRATESRLHLLGLPTQIPWPDSNFGYRGFRLRIWGLRRRRRHPSMTDETQWWTTGSSQIQVNSIARLSKGEQVVGPKGNGMPLLNEPRESQGFWLTLASPF